jgi:uncharacterized membrane protein
MKAFVLENQSERRLGILAGALLIALFLAAEATNELAYLLIYALMAIQYARKLWREKRQGSSKALLDAARNKDSR